MTSADYLHSAFLLAKRANSKDIRPNPFVGAIVVDAKGIIIGEGFHQKAGEAHAEVLAINDALAKSKDLSNSTLYVSLEPCSHSGKTPPCTHLILEHKIPKVVIGSMDPNPLVAGAKELRDAGVNVEICILPEIVELNSTFNINQLNKRPKYILKAATTLNGKMGDRFGNSKWISNDKSRNYVHQVLRTNADAILTTATTVIKDNATMNIRGAENIKGAEAKELNLIIIDKQLDILKEENKSLNIFYKREKSKIYLVTDKNFENTLPEHIELINVNIHEGECDLNQLSTILLNKNICEVLVEAGGKLNASLIKAKIVDELNIFICPSLLIDNRAINLFNSSELQGIENTVQLSLLESQSFDNDIMMKYTVLY
jgi:diaminohydroxyphosphoribosylaminopyrimidine deaminase / 5-amino-6-(5-phosphoribosylamino)uracil reductase